MPLWLVLLGWQSSRFIDPTEPFIAWLGFLKLAYCYQTGISIVGDYAHSSGIGVWDGVRLGVVA